jgi:UDP-N-acetylglucosamine--N-acetylmuramyl-(pentapeptide) pyrophosphoryl-undecaprenol N-acetylglucosamine transferase
MVTPQSAQSASGRRFLIACGGTGGHLFPGISIAQELQRRGHDVLLLVSPKEIDRRALEPHPHLARRQIAMSGMPRPLSLAMIGFLFKFWKAYRTCRKLVRQHQADAVLGMGGFTSMPPILAAHRLGKPTFIHESNSIPGKANRLTARFCSAVFVGMEVCQRHFPDKTCHLVGTPVRDELREPGDAASARQRFGLRPDRFTMLVMGGSQGAQGLNRAVCTALPELDPERIQFLHLTGKEGEEEVRQAYAQTGLTHHVAPFCDDMHAVLHSADGALCRSGASSLSELAFFGIPSILVPYPFAAENHQTFNAKPLADAGAALLCPESELTGPRLAELIRTHLLEAKAREAMQKNLQSFSSHDANIKICDIMEAQTA